jgi:long-chain acyl-CoA synthetase
MAAAGAGQPGPGGLRLHGVRGGDLHQPAGCLPARFSPADTSGAMRGGWLHTGDIGHLDTDGYLYVVDRKKDLIIRGGFNVVPRDIEDVLVQHPAVAVAMAGAVGRPDARLGEEIVAFVSLRPGASALPDELNAFACKRLAAHKYPREVRILDALPLTSVGKLDRRALRARAPGG